MRPTSTQDDLTELRLLVEEIVCNVFRFAHEADDKVSPENVFIRQEAPLQPDHAFADIQFSVSGVGACFVEVDLG